MNNTRVLLGLVLATSLTTASLQSTAAQMQTVKLQFAGEFAGQAVDCAARYDNIGLTGATVGVSDYRLYVSRVRLLGSNGEETEVTLLDQPPWQYDGVALLDFEDGSGNCTNGTAMVNSDIEGQVPEGEYIGVAFDIGVPFEKNHQDPTLAASPLNLTALFWNWRGGYRFLRVDLLPEREGLSDVPSKADESHSGQKSVAEQKSMAEQNGKKMAGMPARAGAGWALHIGSTGCLADSPTRSPTQCKAHNRIVVNFPEADPLESVFVIDPAVLLRASDVLHNTEGTSPGCMSAPDDPECAPVLKALGLTSDVAVQTLVSVH